MKRLAKVYLNEDDYDRVKQAAAAKNMSISSFLSSAVMTSINRISLIREAYEENDQNCKVTLHGESALKLRRAAKAKGLSPTGYIKDCILNKEMISINLPTDTELEMLRILLETKSEITECIKALYDQELIPAELVSELNLNLLLIRDSFEKYCHKTDKLSKKLNKTLERAVREVIGGGD